MDTSRTREKIKIHEKKSKIGYKLRKLHPISVTKPKSMEKVDNHHETFNSVNNAVTYVIFNSSPTSFCEMRFQQFIRISC